MIQRSSGIKATSLLVSVALHAMVLATVPDIIGESGTGPAESGTTLYVNIQRPDPADIMPMDNPGPGRMERPSASDQGASPPQSPLSEAIMSDRAAIKTISRVKVEKAPTPEMITESHPASDRSGADSHEIKPMQVARPGQTARNSRDYQSNLIRLIERHKYYPLYARRKGLEGTSTVAFTVSRSGKIAGISLARSSGTTLLDQAALQTIRRIGQAPPFPDEIKRQRWRFAIPIAYNLR